MPLATKELQRDYQREWIAKRRAEWMKGKCCIDCGTTENLQIDHVDRSTKVTHRIWSYSAEKREAELAKCVVRCQPCHQEKTNREMSYGYVVHGDFFRGYRNGCRCRACLDARNARQNRKRAERRAALAQSQRALRS